MKKSIMGKIRRICAGGLAVLLMLTSVPTDQLVFASETDKGTYTVDKIESVSNIDVKYGTPVEELKLPETLNVFLTDTVSDGDATEETTETDTEKSTETEASTEAETPAESEPASTSEAETESKPETESSSESESSDASETAVREEEEKAETVIVELPENQAVPKAQSVETLSLDKEEKAKEESKTTINADIPVTWNCENYDGQTAGEYSFTASFKEDTYENHKLVLADGVTMPEIKVTVLEDKSILLKQDIDGITITLKAAEGVFPADATLSVEKIEEAEKIEKIEQSINDTIAQTEELARSTEEPKTVEKTYSYDIKVLDADGNELQPDNEKGTVTVSFTNVEIPTEAEGEEKSIEVYHVDDTLESAEAVTTEVKADEKTVEITPEHFSIYVVTVTGGTQLRYFKGATSAEQYYMISTAAELQAFSDIVSGRTSGTVLVYTESGTTSTMYTSALNKNAKLMNDITGVANWIPICNGSTEYAAIFDGNGYSITIDSLSSAVTSYVGIFGILTSGATIKNLTAKGTITATGNFVGGIAGYAKAGSIITNCNNQANVMGSQFVGGITGVWYGTTLSNCTNSGTITTTNTSAAYAGGICGRNGRNMVVDKCSNTGTITSNTSSNGLGGIAGSNLGTIQNCYNGGNLTASSASQVGGIVGANEDSSGIVQNSYNWGNTSGNSQVGGVVGYNIGTVQGVYNIGSVTGTSSGDAYVGGIVGEILGGTIYYVHNTGTVKSSGQGVGGITGGNWQNVQAPISITNCWNEGTVVGTPRSSDGMYNAGGVAGIFQYSTTNTLYMGWCYNIGTVCNTTYTGLQVNGNYSNKGIGCILGYYTGASGATVPNAFSGFGNTVLLNMNGFYSAKGSSLGLMSWTGTATNPSLSGSYGSTTVTSTEVKDRPYYTTDGNVVRVYANGLPIVVHGYSSDATTAVYWDKNSNGTYDTGDASITKKDGTGGCSFSSASYTFYVYGGGEGVDFGSSTAKISIEGGKVNAIFGGGNGAYIYAANIYVKGGTVGDIYASALNYSRANTTGSFCIYLSGGTVTGNVKGYYNSSSTMGRSNQIHVSGNPSVTGSIDLSTFTDKYVYIDAALTGGAGSIKLINPSSTAENTNVAYSSSTSYTNANVFSLASYRLRASGNYVQIKNYFDQTVYVQLDGVNTDITSVFTGADGLYVKSSSTSYQQMSRSAAGQYKVSNLATGTSYSLYYKKGTSYNQIEAITCSETSNTVKVKYVSVVKDLINMNSSNTDAATRQSRTYDTTLIPMTGYSLPESIIITCSGTLMSAGTDYSYDNQTGSIFIGATKVTGAIKITTDAVTPYFEENNGGYNVYGSGYYLKVEANGDDTKVTWCETENGTYKTLYHKTDSTKNANALTGKITIYGGNNGKALDGDTHILMNGGTVDTIYGGSKGGNVGNTSITITGGTTGYVYGGSSSGTVTGTSNISISGRPIITGFVDLSTFTDKLVNITGEISSKSGGIVLKNPSAVTTGTVVARATTASNAVAKKFVLLDSTGTTVAISKVGTDIVVTAGGTLDTALNEASTNVTADLVHFGTGKAIYATIWTGTILPTDGYKLPDGITVKAGEKILTRTTDTVDGEYTYNKVTGEIIVEAESVLGNIDVTAAGVPISYTITYNGNGGTVTGTTSETVNYGQTITFPEVTAPADGWSLVGWSQTYNAVENSSETEVAKKIYKNSTTDSFSKVDRTSVTLYAIWKTASGNTSLLNGSFEYPIRPQWTNMVIYSSFPQMYWMTTANDKKIELGRPSINVSASWSAYHVREASDGEQFAELNANSVAALYQIVQTVPGKTLNWGLDHRARSTKEKETMELWIGKPTDIAAAINAYKKAGNTVDTACATILQRTGVLRVENITDDCNDWYTHTGTYLVPDGQTQTTFAFVSRSKPASNSMGNLLDNVYFTMQAPKAKRDITVRTSNGGTANVTVDAATSSVTGSNEFKKTVEYDSVLRIIPLANEGYTYNGALVNGVYKSKADLEKDYNSLLFTVNAETPAEITLLYAKDSTVSLVANGGVLSDGEQLLVADVSQSKNKINLAEYQPTRNGYLLSGWLVAGTDKTIGASGTVIYETDNATGNTILKATDGTNTVSIVTEEGIMLIAQWAVDDVNLTKTVLTLDTNNGSYGEYAVDTDGNQMLDEDGNPVIVPLQTEYTIDASYMGDGALVLETPIRTGYIFLGWKDETTGFTTAENGVAADSTVIYSIDGSTAQLTVKESDTVFVTKDAPATLTLTAQWKKQTYVLTVPTGNGYEVTDTTGTALGNDAKVTHGEDYSFKVPTNAGYDADSMTVAYKTPDGVDHVVTADADGVYKIPGADITGAIEIIVTGLQDTKAPTGAIQVGAEDSNKWSSFLNNITFGIFFKETQNVTITAEDTDGSGIKKIEYYVTDTALTNETGSTAVTDIKNADISWTTYSNGFSIDPNKEVIIYAKITDNAANVTYISTNGLVLDDVQPVIAGVENNGTYTGTTEVTITDSYLSADSIKATNDGKAVTVTPDVNGKFTLPPASKPYSITVTDKAGNVTGPITFTINWSAIAVPEIDSKPYTGSTQTADVAENTAYTVTTNAGGINVNEYNVVLTLTDPVNTAWKAATGSDTYVVNTTDGTVTCKFAITKADNSFTSDLKCDGFDYNGATAASASVTSLFGTPEYTYYTDEACSKKTTTSDGAEATGGAPKNADTYYVVASVAGTSNYSVLASSPLEFVIAQASQNKPVLTSTDETYENQSNGIISGVTSAMEYTTDPNGTWTKVTSAQNTAKKIEDLAADTYYVRYVADDNHTASEYVTITIGVGSKIEITFTADGCDTETLASQKVNVTYNSELTESSSPVLPAVPDKTGYEAKGWKLSGTEDNQLITSITAIKTPAAYVAVYEPKTFTITLSDEHSAGGTDKIYEKYQTGFFKDQNCTNQMTNTENAITVPAKTGYTFNGYYTESDGSGEKVIGADGYFTTNVDSNLYKADSTIYAYWRENSYNISVMIEGSGVGKVTVAGVGAAGESTGTTTYTKTNNITITPDNGYDITSIYIYVNGVQKQHYTNATIPEFKLSDSGYGAGDVDISINTELVFHDITFRNTTNTSNTLDYTILGNVPSKFAQVNGITLPIAEKTGYDFQGWKISGTNDVITAIPAATAQDVVLVPVFSNQTYKIIYQTKGGTLTGSYPQKYVFGTQKMLPTSVDGAETGTISRTGYTFDGWYTTEGYTGDAVTAVSTTDTGNKTFYAKWTRITYTVTLPTGTTGYTVNAAANATSPVDYDGSYSFTVDVAAGYSQTGTFKVIVNKGTATETVLSPTTDGGTTYTMDHILENKTVTVEGIGDITAPAVEIKVTTSTWRNFLNDITFGIFFKDTQAVTITGTDTGSGVKTIYYYTSDHEITLDQVKALSDTTDWKTGSSFNIEPNQKVIIYAKVVDNANNVTYASSQGIVLDNVAPAITEITNGGTYQKTQYFTVSDLYLKDTDAVTIDGEAVTAETTGTHAGAYKLVPKDSGSYTIVVTDKAGNQTTYNVTVQREEVTVPVLASKTYNGETQRADILESEFYTETKNAGGIDVSSSGYDVQLTLSDMTNYKWKVDNTRSDYTINEAAGMVSMKFQITKADNTFTTALTCEGFNYTGSAAQASAVSAFGAPVYTYYTNAGCTSKTSTDDGADVAGGAPVNAGTYYVKATVSGTGNYNALESDGVKFVISVTDRVAPTVGHTDVSYTGQTDGTITEIKTGMEWTTTPDDAGSWTKVTAEQISSGKITALAAGTYYVRVEADRNHNISAVATVVIDTKIKVPVKVFIAPPVYDTNHLDEVTVKGTVTKGEYDVTAQSFSYRKEGDSLWTTIDTIGSDVTLTGLSTDTIYELKLTATDSYGNVATDIQKFRTLKSSAETGKITGSVEGDDSKEFSVSIKLGSTIVTTLTGLHTKDRFVFENLADGEYNLEATDGEYKVTIMVTVKNGSTEDLGVVSVTRKQTIVEVEDGAPNVAVDGLGDIFDTSVVTDNEQAKDVLDNGGTVEIRLTASETTTQQNINSLNSKADASGKVIGMMTDLDVDLIVIPLSGETTTSSITDTQKLILVAIPLADSAKGKTGYQAYRVHDGETQTLAALGTSDRVSPTKEGFYVDGDYLYIVARYFSSYALAYDKPVDPNKPTDPSDPTDPSNPTDPSKPSDPSKPTHPSKPTDTSEPTDTSKPADTTTATDTPVVTVTPQNPVKQDETQQNVDATEQDTTEDAKTDTGSENGEGNKQEQDTTETGKPADTENQTGADEADGSESNHCNWHWYMLLLMAAYVLFIMIGNKKSLKMAGIVFAVDIVLTFIMVIVGFCNLDIPFAIGTLIVAGASVPVKNILSKNEEEDEDEIDK